MRVKFLMYLNESGFRHIMTHDMSWMSWQHLVFMTRSCQDISVSWTNLHLTATSDGQNYKELLICVQWALFLNFGKFYKFRMTNAVLISKHYHKVIILPITNCITSTLYEGKFQIFIHFRWIWLSTDYMCWLVILLFKFSDCLWCS